MTGLTSLLQSGIEDGAFPGAAFAVGSAAQTWVGYAGRQTYDLASPPVCADTLWDLASVTKVVGTTSAAMLLVADGLLSLESDVRDFRPEFSPADVTVRDLLLHRSGLPPYLQATDLQDRAEVWTRICGVALTEKPGRSSVYSCVGFIVLQHVLEQVAGCSLDSYLRERLFRPMGMTRTTYNPPAELRHACSPTQRLPKWQQELEDRRGFVRVQNDFVQGDVHDPLACVMGGVSGNAGLFSTPSDVAAFLRGYLHDQGALPLALRIAWTTPADPESSRALGWDTKSPEGSSAGARFSASSFGHTGYTGTSVWVDPESGFFAALLTNRVHPDDDNLKIAEFRPRFHDAAFGFLKNV